MKWNGLIFIVYSLLLLVGGVFGYVKAGSIASIITSFSFGGALIAMSIFILKGKRIAEYSAFFTTLTLDAFFWWRYYSTGKFMPAGVMLLLSTLVIFFVYFNLKKSLRDA